MITLHARFFSIVTLSASFSLSYKLSDLSITEMRTERITAPTKTAIIVRARQGTVLGKMPPYPTVVIEMMTNHTEEPISLNSKLSI